jgi:hypothetical protein
VIDARCALDAAQWRDAGWTVHVLGRPDRGSPAGGPESPERRSPRVG